ncbi:MAG TPA: cupin domain-containing protein [Longimicrobium sp.]
MRGMTCTLAAAALVLTGVHAAAQQQPAPPAGGMRMVANSSLTWADANIPGFAPGMKMAVVDGNPAQAGPYTMRLSFPDGYRFPPHWHPAAENLTVLSGTFLLAMGERADESGLHTYGAGDYFYIPPQMPHFGGARGETVIQLHGTGPFAINLVNAPRP